MWYKKSSRLKYVSKTNKNPANLGNNLQKNKTMETVHLLTHPLTVKEKNRNNKEKSKREKRKSEDKNNKINHNKICKRKYKLTWLKKVSNWTSSYQNNKSKSSDRLERVVMVKSILVNGWVNRSLLKSI